MLLMDIRHFYSAFRLYMPKRTLTTFKYLDLDVIVSKNRKIKPEGKLGFGKFFTDHMLTVTWEKAHGWGKPRIHEYSPLIFAPSIKAIHYATSTFEGLKAHKCADGNVRIFRPDRHMERFLLSAQRISLPRFEPEELLACIKKLIQLDKSWVPEGEGESLYIRPILFGSDETLGVDISANATLCTMLSPVGSYFEIGHNGASLYANPQLSRSFRGGSGAFKISANYAPTLYAQRLAREKGCHTSLWLYGPEEIITEAGTMNIFVFWTNEQGKKELITPPLSDLILPGVTRESVVEIVRSWNEFEVVEKDFTMADVLKALEEKRLYHMFGTGTACVISPVAKVYYRDKNYTLPFDSSPNSLPERIRRAYVDIQLAVHGPHPWTQSIE